MNNTDINGLDNKTFGIVIGIVVAAALAMFGGLYFLGLQGTPSEYESFDAGYQDPVYQYDDYTGSDDYTEYYPTDDSVDASDYYFDDFEPLPYDSPEGTAPTDGGYYFDESVGDSWFIESATSSE